MRIALIPFVIAALAALAAPALAGGEVGVVVTGDGAIQPQLTAQIEDWLVQHKHQLVAAPLPPDAVTALHDCFVLDDRGCARDVVDKRGRAHTVIFAVVEVAKADNGMRDITLAVYWFEKGHEAMTERRSCQRCTDQTLRAAADGLMQHLSDTTTKNRGHLKLTTTPSGARVLIDGERIGATPLEYDLAAGKHAIAISHPDYRDDVRTVVIREDATEALEVPLVSTTATGDDHRGGGSALRYLPYALVGAGAAIAVTGAVLIAVDQDKGPQSPPTIHDTAPAGVAMLVGGVVIGGVGGYLWWRSGHAASSAPTAAVSRDGASFGWIGRF